MTGALSEVSIAGPGLIHFVMLSFSHTSTFQATKVLFTIEGRNFCSQLVGEDSQERPSRDRSVVLVVYLRVITCSNGRANRILYGISGAIVMAPRSLLAPVCRSCVPRLSHPSVLLSFVVSIRLHSSRDCYFSWWLWRRREFSTNL